MSKQFHYDHGKYSAKDIVKAVEEWGHRINFQSCIPGKREEGFLVEGIPILVRLPNVDYIERVILPKGGK